MDNRTEPVRSACRHASGGHTRTCEREWMTTTGTSVVNYLAHTHDEIDLALVPTGVPVGVSLRVRSNARVIRGFLGTELTAWHVRRSCYRDRFRLGGGTRSRSCCFSTLAGLRRRWLILRRSFEATRACTDSPMRGPRAVQAWRGGWRASREPASWPTRRRPALRCCAPLLRASGADGERRARPVSASDTAVCRSGHRNRARRG